MSQPEENAPLPSARIEVAESLMKLRRFDLAIEQLRHVLAQDPHHATALAVMAICFAKTAHDASVNIARAAVASDPSLAFAHYALAICLWRAQRYRPDIASAFQTAHSLAPWRADFMAEYARYLLAQNENHQALQWADRALAIAPHDDDCHIQRCNILVALNRPQEALIHAQSAIQINPENTDTQAALGNALLALGHFQEASVPLREALRLNPVSTQNQIQLLESLKHRTPLHKVARAVEYLLSKIKYSHFHVDPEKRIEVFSKVGPAVTFVAILVFVTASSAPDLAHSLFATLLVGLVSLVALFLAVYALVAILRSLVIFALLKYPDIQPLIPATAAAGARGTIMFVVLTPPSIALLWFACRSPISGFHASATAFAMTLAAFFVTVVVGQTSHFINKCFTRTITGLGALFALALIAHPYLSPSNPPYLVLTSPLLILAPVMLLIALVLAIAFIKDFPIS